MSVDSAVFADAAAVVEREPKHPCGHSRYAARLTLTRSKCCGACCSTDVSFTTLGRGAAGMLLDKLRPTALRPVGPACLSISGSSDDDKRFCFASRCSFSLR